MKKLTTKIKMILAIAVLLFTTNVFGQPTLTWSAQTTRPGTAESQTVIAACNGIIYSGIGNSNSNQWMAYDPATNTWTTKTSMPGLGRNQCVAFAIGTKVYVGLGYTSTGTFPTDFYQYETTTDTWTNIGSWPNAAGATGGFAWTINGKGYVGGFNPKSSNELYEFDPAGNTWATKANIPTYIQYTAAFTINNKGYYACGWVGNGSNTSETYEYDPSINTWTQKANAPTAVRQTSGFSINNLGFVSCGYSYTNAVMQYDPSVNSWSSATSFPYACHEGKATNIGNTAYFTPNKNGSNVALNDFYKATMCNFPLAPTVSASSNNNCAGSNVTLNVTSGTLNDATAWTWYSGNCSGTTVGSGTSVTVNPGVSTNYYARGTGGCVTTANCGNVSVNVINAVLSGSKTICSGTSANLTINCAGTGPFSGSLTDGTAFSSSTSPISVQVSPASNTTYAISTFSSNGVSCSGSTSGTATITVNGQPPVTTGATINGPGVANLSATGSGTLDWYDLQTGGNYLTTGTTYSPNINSTTTFYVSNTEASNSNYTIGPPPTPGNSASSPFYLIFTAAQNATLASVTVLPITAGAGSIALLSNTGALITYQNYTITPSDLNIAKVINLNFNLTGGNIYRLSKMGLSGIGSGIGNFNFNTSGFSYPFTAPGSPVTITGTNLPPTFYPYFYNMVISVAAQCISVRTPVTATIAINSPPVFSCGGNITQSIISGCDAVVNYSIPVSGAPAPSVSYVFSGATTGSGSGNGSGALFNKGTTSVALTATNANGTDVCSFNVIVNDLILPTITCPTNLNVNTDVNSCYATNIGLGNPLVADNCSGATSTSLFNGNAITNSTQFSVGLHTIDWTATDASGNTATCNQTVTVSDNQLPVIAAPANVVVAANNAGCTYNGSIGTANVTDNCSAVSSFTPAGPYAVGNTTVTWLATDASGNTAMAIQTITVLPLATSSVITNVKCKGSNSGEIDLTISQSNGVLSYLWNTGSTNQDVNNLFAGNYTVTVTNSNGCTKKTTFSVSQPLVIFTVSVSKTNVRCGGKATGEAIASGTGGVAPYAYEWGNGSTADTRSNLLAGTYTVTVTDASGCSKTKSVTITENTPQTVSVIPFSANQYYADNGGGVAPYQYYWNTAPAQTTQTATILTTGSNYKVKVTDSKGCTVLSSAFSVAKVGQTSSNVVGIAVMPNPTTGLVTLTVSNCINCNVLINMFDAIGQEVYSKEMKVENNTTLDFIGLATGIYTMRVMYDGRIEVVKIVIQDR